MGRSVLSAVLLFFATTGTSAKLPQDSATITKTQPTAYPNTSDGFHKLVSDILLAAKAKDMSKEANLIHSLLIPQDSTWFTDEYGPGFGASLAAAYRRVTPGLEQEIKIVYEGNVQRGWTTPKIFRYVDPESVDAPLDRFLNCMDQIVPLYTTGFQGDSQDFYMSQKPGENGTQIAGDLDGYFIYDQGSFRFIPIKILMELPNERPVRIQLDMNVMNSKLLTDVPVSIPQVAIEKRISGRVVIEMILGVDGNIKETKVIEGDPILSAAVTEAVKQWRFAPTALDGDPVEVDLQDTFTFEIH